MPILEVSAGTASNDDELDFELDDLSRLSTESA